MPGVQGTLTGNHPESLSSPLVDLPLTLPNCFLLEPSPSRSFYPRVEPSSLGNTRSQRGRPYTPRVGPDPFRGLNMGRLESGTQDNRTLRGHGGGMDDSPFSTHPPGLFTDPGPGPDILVFPESSPRVSPQPSTHHRVDDVCLHKSPQILEVPTAVHLSQVPSDRCQVTSPYSPSLLLSRSRPSPTGPTVRPRVINTRSLPLFPTFTGKGRVVVKCLLQ